MSSWAALPSSALSMRLPELCSKGKSGGPEVTVAGYWGTGQQQTKKNGREGLSSRSPRPVGGTRGLHNWTESLLTSPVGNITQVVQDSSIMLRSTVKQPRECEKDEPGEANEAKDAEEKKEIEGKEKEKEKGVFSAWIFASAISFGLFILLASEVVTYLDVKKEVTELQLALDKSRLAAKEVALKQTLSELRERNSNLMAQVQEMKHKFHVSGSQ